MKILVCFKIVPEFDRIVDADWDHFSLTTDLGYVKRSFGCFDETALETALRLKDSLQNQHEHVECDAVTVGFLPALFRKTLYAVGFNHVWNVEVSEKQVEFRSWDTAAVLSYAIKNLITASEESRPWDLILAGRQVGYADSGMVPLLLAERLHIPVITEAERLAVQDGVLSDSEMGTLAEEKQTSVRGLVIERSGETGRERIRIRLPAVVVMGNSPIAALRAATLAAQMQAAKRQPETLLQTGESPVPDSISAMLSHEARPQLFRALSRKNCCFLSDENTLAQSVMKVTTYLQKWGNR